MHMQSSQRINENIILKKSVGPRASKVAHQVEVLMAGTQNMGRENQLPQVVLSHPHTGWDISTCAYTQTKHMQ